MSIHRVVARLGLAPSLALAWLVACGAPESETPPPAEPAAAAPAAPAPAASSSLLPREASGVYEVHGVTVHATDGRLREISGTLRLHVKGETFSATYELDTTYPGPEQGIPATVAGWGQGMVVGDTMAGTISSSVVPTEPAPEPTARTLPEQELLVMSSSVMRFTPAGTIQLELQNHPGIGQDYSPTVTVLEGQRVRPLQMESAAAPQ